MPCPARAALAFLLTTACASTAPATSTSTSTPTTSSTARPPSSPGSTSTSPSTSTESAFTRALAAAQTARNAATAMLPPRYEGNGGKESVAAFIATPMKQWFTEKKNALTAAESAYFKAITAAGSADERVLALSELAPLWADFCDEMVRGTPVPLEWQPDPDRVRAYVDGISTAQEPMRDRSRTFADRCVDEARAASLDTPAAHRCVELRSRLQRR